MPPTVSDRTALVKGLQEALEITEKDTSGFSYETIVRGTTASILKVKGIPYKKKNLAAIVKWFRNVVPGETREPVHDIFNNLDLLYNAEERNLRNIEALLGRTFVPEVYGKSSNSRLIVMEPLGSKTRKDKFLAAARESRYTGESTEVPENVLNIFHNAIAILGPFVGACQARADDFVHLHSYTADAEYREARLVPSFEERLLRLHHRFSKGKSLGVDLAKEFQEISDASKPFAQLESFYHGDFNLLQILGEKIIDFELFGRNVRGKDLASLLVVAGLKNSAGIIASPQFENIFDQYLVSVQKTSEAIRERLRIAETEESTPSHITHGLNKTLSQAIRESRSLSKISASDLHLQAIQVCGGEQEYANLVFSVYHQALNKCIRLGAAFDRMDDMKDYLKINGDEIAYSSIISGLQRGMSSLLTNMDENKERFKLVSPAKEKKEIIRRYQFLLSETGII